MAKNTEEIIEQVGGMSFFQIIMMAVMYGPKILVAWGMLMMSFAGTTPDWWCVPEVEPQADRDSPYPLTKNVTLKSCPSNETSCLFVYSQDKNTIINEWNLICGNSKTTAMITSIQMFGVLLGALLGGQSADMLGRKPTFYMSLLLEGSFNLVAAFSVSWQMFTVLRFFIGMAIGSLLVVSYPYFMEFVGQKWRPICSAVPFWVTGVCLMALSCWLRPDWSHQHMILAALHVPFLCGWFIVPESLRWLAVKGRLEEAERVVELICRYNRREKPDNTKMLLMEVAEEEQRFRETGKKYTYIDVYRGWSICWKSLIIQFVWMCESLVYYGISFGAGKLSGNLYLNIFLLSVVEVPGAVVSFFLNNKIGRRWTCLLYFATATVGAYGVAIASRVAPEEQQGSIINALALVSKLGVGASWGAFQVLTSETYPTVTRNLGYGAANTASRIGGIISPYIFAMEGDDVLVPFIIVGSVMATCGILSLIMRETMGTPLEDSSATGINNSVEKVNIEGNGVFKTKL